VRQSWDVTAYLRTQPIRKQQSWDAPQSKVLRKHAMKHRCATYSQNLHLHKNTKCHGLKSCETLRFHLHNLMLDFPPPRGKRALASTSSTFQRRLPQISLKHFDFSSERFSMESRKARLKQRLRRKTLSWFLSTPLMDKSQLSRVT